MDRIERRPNPVRKKIFRWLLLLAVMIAVVYGYMRIPYFVVKQNLTLQHNYTYETYAEVLKRRAPYLTEEYLKKFDTYASIQEQIEYMKEHKESCRLLSLEIGTRQKDGSIPYSAVYEISYADGETKTKRIHTEGIQSMKRTWLIWWKVSDNGITHSCTDLDAEETHSCE